MHNSSKPERLLTRYLVFRSDAAGERLEYVGESLARSSDEALRKHFSQPPSEDTAGYYVAINENARKVRHVRSTVKTSIGDVADGGQPVAGEQLAETLPV